MAKTACRRPLAMQMVRPMCVQLLLLHCACAQQLSCCAVTGAKLPQEYVDCVMADNGTYT